MNYPQLIVPVGHIEPVPRRIRAFRGTTLALDTTRALYVWEQPHYPQYYVPAADVAAQFRGSATVRETSWQHGQPELNASLRFPWSAFDRWFEEDEEVFVHPRSPYTRVDALRSSRPIRVDFEGLLLAESASPIMVFETGLPTRYYLDKTAVNLGLLEPSDTVTGCPYKGTTSAYWSVRQGSRLIPDVAWCYDFPTRQLLPIAGLIAFYNDKVNIAVG